MAVNKQMQLNISILQKLMAGFPLDQALLSQKMLTIKRSRAKQAKLPKGEAIKLFSSGVNIKIVSVKSPFYIWQPKTKSIEKDKSI